MNPPVSKNITHHESRVTRHARERLNGHKGITLWFTGLSGSGKSTLAVACEEALYERGCRTYILDGDNVRGGLNSDLGFAPEDRVENIRRIGEVAKLYRETGVINLVAFISPYRADRDLARGIAKDGDFIEVFIDCPLDVCEERDPKGLYKKARAGDIPEFTGISAPYEAPDNPEIHLHTDQATVQENVQSIIEYLENNHYISRL